ncbi:MAG: plasmid replication protein, CyRepA1 family, partial [Crocosphaera sp.]
IPLVLDEGVKKALCTLSGGNASVSVFGCTCGAKWNALTKRYELIPQLKPLVDQRKVIITMDQGDTNPKSINAVQQGTKHLGQAIKNDGGQPYVAVWDRELGKGIDDVAANHGLEKVQEILDNAIPFDEWLESQVETNYLTYLPSVNVNQRYFNVKIPDNKLVAIKGPQNTGKTEQLSRRCRRAIKKGRPIFILSHLENLARALGERLGVPYRTERNEDGDILGYALVTDSLRPKRKGFDANHWDPERWEDRKAPLVIIDECEQVIWHTLNGETDIKEHRVQVLKQLKKLVNIAHQIILADADLSNESIDFIQGLLNENVEPYIMVNDYQHEGWDNFTFSSLLEWHSGLIKKVSEGKKLLILTAAQKVTSKNGTRAIYNRLTKLFPHLRILRYDSETLTEKGHPACENKGHLNSLFQQYDIVVGSPSIVSGVSLDFQGHFDEVWASSTGAISPSNFVQFLWRLRDNVPRFIYVDKISNIGRVGNGSTNPVHLMRSEKKKCQLTLQSLKDFDYLCVEDIDAPMDSVCMKTWAKMGARINQQNKAYRATVYALLDAQNHRRSLMSDCLDPEERKAERKALTDNRDQGMDSECEQRVQAKEIDGEEAKRLEQTIIKTSEEKAELERYKLKQKYGQVTKEIAKADMVGLHPKLKLHYHLTMGREFIEAKDTAKVKTLLENNEGAAFIPDVNRVTKINKVKGLEALNVLELVDLEREFVATDEDLIDRAKLAIHNTEEIKTLLGISICQPTANPKTGEITIPSIKVARQQLNLIGHDLKRSKRRIIDGKQEYIYKVVDLLPNQTRSEIFNYWLTKDRESCMVSSESIEKAQENQIVRQTVYDKSTPRTNGEGLTTVVPPPTLSASEPVARQTVYNKSTPRTDETTPLKVGMEIITQATMKIGRIVSVSEKLSEVLVEFVDQVTRYQLSVFWDEVELIV